MRINNNQILRKVVELSDGRFTLADVTAISKIFIPALCKRVASKNILISKFGRFSLVRTKPKKFFDPETKQYYSTRGTVRAILSLSVHIKNIIKKNIID